MSGRQSPETDLKWAVAFVNMKMAPDAKVRLLVEKLTAVREEGPKDKKDA